MIKQRINILLLCFLLFPIISHSKTNQDSIKQVINRLDLAIQARDIQKLKECLSDNYSINVATWPGAKRYLDPLLQNNKIQKVELIRIDQLDEGEIKYATIAFRTKEGNKTESIIAFDRDYKILFIDYFDKLFGQSRYNKSEEMFTIPFTIDQGYIVLSLKLNENKQPLRFLFDTGADGMAIRKSLADSLNLTTSHNQNTNVVGGTLQVNISSGNTVHLTESLSLKNQNIALFEQEADGLDGIIGLNLVTNYITKVDFDKQQIILYSFGDHQYEKEGETLSITNPQTVVLIPGTLNIVGKKAVEGNFVFDTGAHYHLIAFSQFVRKNRLLLTGFKPEEGGTTVSMGVVTPVYKGKAFSFQFAPNISFTDMPVTLQASTGQEDPSRKLPAGSIGIELIKNFNFTIDLLKKEVHLSPRQKK